MTQQLPYNVKVFGPRLETELGQLFLLVKARDASQQGMGLSWPTNLLVAFILGYLTNSIKYREEQPLAVRIWHRQGELA